MRAVERSAVLLWCGVALFVGALVLDTWRAGAFFLRQAMLVSAVLFVLGLVGLIVAVARAPEGARRFSPVSLLLTALAIVVVVEGAGFVVLARKGYSADVGQFVRIREQHPFGPAQFDRGADSAILMTLTHGSGIAVERTMYPLDVTPSQAQLVAAEQLIEHSRHNAARFADYQADRATLGYTVAAAELAGDDTPSIEHLLNPEYMKDDRLVDPERPEGLVFQTLRSGEKKLVAIMYMTRPGQHGPQVGGPLTRWHWHPWSPACLDKFGILVEKRVNGRCRKGLSEGPTSEMLHVWLVDQAFGAFSHLMGAPGEGAPATMQDHSMHH